MRSGLCTLNQADPAAVKEYLVARQIDSSVVDWKYFDSRFNGERERGVVWVRDNQVAGFLGLIPFRLENDGVCANCAWSCDWSVDPHRAAGVGLLLVQEARRLFDGIFNLGGSENTRRILRRMADRTISGAGVSLVLPLRLGSVLARLPGFIKGPLSRRDTLMQLPLRWVRQPTQNVITIAPGLWPQISSVADNTPGRAWCPLYDSEFLAWQFQRCPVITCWSCWVTLESPLRTAAVIWRRRNSKEFWRLAFCGETTDGDKMKTLMTAIVSFVYSQGCVALFAVASHRENELLKLLRRCGFLRYGSLPLHIMRGRHAAAPMDELIVLNLLDTDLSSEGWLLFSTNDSRPDVFDAVGSNIQSYRSRR